MSRDIVLFDVCNTLYDSNTTFDFIAYTLQRKFPVRYRFFWWFTQKWSPLFVAGALWDKIFKKDILRSVAIRLLKGISKTELEQLAALFYKEHLGRKQIGDVLQMLYAAKEVNEIWLFSNSLEPVIKMIALQLGVRYEATRLKYDQQGRFTGLLEWDMTGKKKEVFEQRFGKEVRLKMMCSDNKSDAPILSLAAQPYVVLYRHTDRKFWEYINPVFIEKF
jgi:phosphoserine phosphatase